MVNTDSVRETVNDLFIDLWVTFTDHHLLAGMATSLSVDHLLLKLIIAFTWTQCFLYLLIIVSIIDQLFILILITADVTVTVTVAVIIIVFLDISCSIVETVFSNSILGIDSKIIKMLVIESGFPFSRYTVTFLNMLIIIAISPTSFDSIFNTVVSRNSMQLGTFVSYSQCKCKFITVDRTDMDIPFSKTIMQFMISSDVVKYLGLDGFVKNINLVRLYLFDQLWVGQIIGLKSI